MLLLMIQCFLGGISGADETVAMLVGGISSVMEIEKVFSTVEIFGCPGHEQTSILVDRFEQENYLTGGVFYDDKVLVCGGVRCMDGDNDGECSFSQERFSDQCNSWTPENGWVQEPPLPEKTWIFNIFKGPNLNHTNNSDNVPIAMGNYKNTFVMDPNTLTWTPYKSTEYNIYSLNCVIEHEKTIYVVLWPDGRCSSLNLNDFSYEEHGTVDSDNFWGGRCSGLEINGHFGIMSTFGQWYNLTDHTVHNMAPPPYPPPPGNGWVARNLFEFRGLPTIFGVRPCSNLNFEECVPNEVWQFQPEENAWIKLGEMSEGKVYHDMIEIPSSVCDRIK